MSDRTIDREVDTGTCFVAPQWRNGTHRAPSSWRYAAPAAAMLVVALLIAVAIAPAPGGDPAAVPAPLASEIIATVTGPRQAGEAADPPPPGGVWLRVDRPIATFGFAGPDFEKLPGLYAAARHTGGGGRDDVLLFGRFDGDGPHLRLSVYRPGVEAALPASFFVDLARRASEAGLAVRRSMVATPLPTKFGPFEAAEALLAGPAGDRACLAFRLLSEEPRLRLAGWTCGAPARPAERAALACLIDRFALLMPGDERALRSFFASAEGRRDPSCAPPVVSAKEQRPANVRPARPPSLTRP